MLLDALQLCCISGQLQEQDGRDGVRGWAQAENLQRPHRFAPQLSMDELLCTLQFFRVCPECLDFGGVCPDQWRSEERAARQDAGWFSKISLIWLKSNFTFLKLQGCEDEIGGQWRSRGSTEGEEDRRHPHPHHCRRPAGQDARVGGGGERGDHPLRQFARAWKWSSTELNIVGGCLTVALSNQTLKRQTNSACAPRGCEFGRIIGLKLQFVWTEDFFWDENCRQWFVMVFDNLTSQEVEWR